MAGRHAAGQTTRRTPLTREITLRTAAPSAAAPPNRRAKAGKDEYRAKHALGRTRRPSMPLATAAAVTVAVVGAAVGLGPPSASTSKAGDPEPATQPTKQPASPQTAQPVSPPRIRPSPSAKTAAARKVRTAVIGTCKASVFDEPPGTAGGECLDPSAPPAAYTGWTGAQGRATNPGNGKSALVRLDDRGPSHSDRRTDLSGPPA